MLYVINLMETFLLIVERLCDCALLVTNREMYSKAVQKRVRNAKI